MQRQCTKCGEPLPTDRRLPLCRACNSARARTWQVANAERHIENQRRWRQEHPDATQRWQATNPERHVAINRRWAAANPERDQICRRAAGIVFKAVKRGELTRPAACEECGAAERQITAAHDDYSRPLDVRWLCRRCHSLWDRADPKTL